MNRPAALGLTLTIVGAVCFAVLLSGITPSNGLILLAGAVVAAWGAVAGIRRTRAAGQLDLFHPLIFPSIYVAIASLAPAAWIWVGGSNLGYIEASFMSTRTPLLMTLAVVGFVLGAGVRFGPARHPGKPIDASTLGAAGRCLLLVPLLLALRDFRADIVLTRGEGQDTFTAADVLNAMGFIAAPAAVAMILSSRLQRGMRLLGPVDAVAILGLVGLLGLNGRRGAALAVMVVVLVFATRRKGANLRAMTGLALMALFAYVVAVYRTSAAGGNTTLSSVAVVLRDLGSVAFTTGGTDLAADGHYHNGATILVGLIRQLPSPIANQILGPPVDTGTYLFRSLSGLQGSAMGYGFSLPAEGVLNFGLIGAFAVPFVAGLVLAWLYGRFDVNGSRALTLLYPIAVGTVPFAWRSDTLGAVKGVLYPAIMLFVTIVFARTVASARTRLRPHGVSNAPRRNREPARIR